MEKPIKSIMVIMFIISFFFCASTSSQEVYKAISPYEWEISSPQKQDLNSKLIAKAEREVSKKLYYTSFLVVRNGYLVVEKYYNGQDKYDLERAFSVTKSYISAAIGKAIEQGYIESIDSKLVDFFPEYFHEHTDPRKYQITIGHLLTMTAGFDREENLMKKLRGSKNMIASIIASDLQFDPGTDFLYSSHGSHLLSGILQKATGMDTFDFVYHELLQPLGVWSIRWAKDPNGVFFGGAGMYITPRDMARFGYLYLHHGKLQGKQILDSDWIRQSVTNHRHYTSKWKEMKEVGYGYLWWTGELRGYPVYFASGFAGQWILVIPDVNMIVVTTMMDFTEREGIQMESLITIVHNYILPAVNDK